MSNTLKEFHDETMAINAEAVAIAQDPVVVEGYKNTSQDPKRAEQHISGIAWRRLGHWYAVYNPKDEALLRIYAMTRKLAAECIKRKYEARRDRKNYDLALDMDIKAQKMIATNLPKIRDEVKRLSLKQLNEVNNET